MPMPFLMSSPSALEARRKLTPSERRLADDKNLHFWTNVAIMIAILIGVAVALSHGGIVTVSIAVFGAAVGLGGVLGFLFGVPGTSRTVNVGSAETISIGAGSHSTTLGVQAKPIPGNNPLGTPDGTVPASANVDNPPTQDASLPPIPQLAPLNAELPPVGAELPLTDAKPEALDKDSPPPQPPQPVHGVTTPPPTPPPVASSNLEQVADWVTKLLLGGGLTQMQRIPPKIWQWSRIVAIGILRDNANPTEAVIQAHQAFAAGLLVYGFIVGFFAGFLITKLQFSKAISS